MRLTIPLALTAFTLSTFIAVATHATEQEALFSDVSASHAYYPAIAWGKATGILSGYPDGSFGSERSVNRAEFLKIVLGAAGVDVTSAVSPTGFPDVDEEAWYASFIRFAKVQGIVKGYPDGSFRPEQAVTAAEALKMAYEALGVSTEETAGAWYERYLRHAQENGVLFTEALDMASGMSRQDVVWIVWKLMTHSGAWGQPVEVPVVPETSTPSEVQFNNGDHIVGSDIQAGTYRTRDESSGCYFSRLKGFSDELEDIIMNENTDAPAIITIAPTDKGFKSVRCGTWTQNLSAITTSRTSFSDGTFIIGTDIEAGTYKSTGDSSCYYSRLSGFGGELHDIIANENTDAPAIVTISASDKGFKSVRCGTWTKIE